MPTRSTLYTRELFAATPITDVEAIRARVARPAGRAAARGLNFKGGRIAIDARLCPERGPVPQRPAPQRFRPDPCRPATGSDAALLEQVAAEFRIRMTPGDAGCCRHRPRRPHRRAIRPDARELD